MIEAGWLATDLQTFSIGKLIWTHEQHQTRAIQREMRWLLNATAAMHTASQGGRAMQERFQALERELRRLQSEPGTDAEPECQTPRSHEEFLKMLADNS
ncbi:MAG: hypothetical protein H7Y43_00210 [Akkermansiaceae bacterium]|nr:hypothetical protein [Verrucomicrobiales bacterium]